jgi:hypothetical protein
MFKQTCPSKVKYEDEKIIEVNSSIKVLVKISLRHPNLKLQ